MAARLVILDCDLTLWDHPNVSELSLPFVRVDDQTVQDAQGVQVRLRSGARELLAGLRDRGVLISVATWNHPEPVFAIFDLLDLTRFFVLPKVEAHPHKDRTIGATLRELARDGVALRPDEVIFVDDKPMHLTQVRQALGPIQTLQVGVDVTDLRDVLAHISRSDSPART
ncbi:MAG TPA: magnesium-dependent phosphatase-1 [bacterium]|nr:magnesium-dependent phosphatase-1 [bacterium]